MLQISQPHRLALTAACVALNLAIGKIANLLSLPLHLDAIVSLTGAALLLPALALAVVHLPQAGGTDFAGEGERRDTDGLGFTLGGHRVPATVPQATRDFNACHTVSRCC
jgi:hypothetical protein